MLTCCFGTDCCCCYLLLVSIFSRMCLRRTLRSRCGGQRCNPSAHKSYQIQVHQQQAAQALVGQATGICSAQTSFTHLGTKASVCPDWHSCGHETVSTRNLCHDLPRSLKCLVKSCSEAAASDSSLYTRSSLLARLCSECSTG